MGGWFSSENSVHGDFFLRTAAMWTKYFKTKRILQGAAIGKKRLLRIYDTIVGSTLMHNTYDDAQ